MMRMHAWIITTALGGKADSPMEMMPLPWESEKEEKSAEEAAAEEEQLEALRQWALEQNKKETSK